MHVILKVRGPPPPDVLMRMMGPKGSDPKQVGEIMNKLRSMNPDMMARMPPPEVLMRMMGPAGPMGPTGPMGPMGPTGPMGFNPGPHPMIRPPGPNGAMELPPGLMEPLMEKSNGHR